MTRARPVRGRQGVILLVVITLLTLFAVVGITFVIYAQAEASSMRAARQAETLQRPDADPELLFAYFLGQLLFDVPDDATGVFSALRGHSLARTMYGYNPGGNNATPFNGPGRLHYQVALGGLGQVDNYNLVNYQYFGPDGFLRDPERYGSRGGPQGAPGPYVGGANVPYTYPDANNMFLAAVRASDGTLLTQSYHRRWLFNPNQALNDPTNPNWANAVGKYLTLRPRPADHSPAFPFPEDGGGDVCNRPDLAGYLDPVTGQASRNDSLWIDLGFPVMCGPDGRKFKPLFAPLVDDLDNRVNVNVNGNLRGSTTGAAGGLDPQNGISLSDQGFGPWEVNLQRVLTAMEGNNYEARRIFIGNGTVNGRYDLNFWGFDWHRLPYQYSTHGYFYSPTNFDANFPSMGVQLPGFGAAATQCFPSYTGNYDGGDFGSACRNHGLLFNFFMPSQSYYYPGAQDRIFDVSHLEALLRYNDTGSPALSSDLFRVCPQSLANPKTRRLVTTHSFDVDRPGVAPWVWDPSAAGQTYTLAAGNPAPGGGPIPFPTPAANLPPAPAYSEFGPDWRALSAALGRINLARLLPDFPTPDPNSHRIDLTNAQNQQNYNNALQARQQLAREIFTCLCQVTGAGNPATATPNTPAFNAFRWLAQLAVNIVDFIDNDNYMTPFNWFTDPNGNAQNNQWVLGTELPWLSLNEVYAEISNDPTDPFTLGKATKPYKVNFWAELHNPLFSGAGPGGQGGTQTLMENAAARLQVAASGNNPAYSVYELAIAKDPQGGPLAGIRNPDNFLGEPDPNNPNKTGPIVQTILASFSPDPKGAQPTVDATVVQPSSGQTTGANGSNQGFYLLGPQTDFPGTDPNKPTATLRAWDQQINGQRSSMVYELPVTTNLAPLPTHALLLRRLACPNLPPQTDKTQPNYNPYVTVDYVDQVPTNDAVQNDSNGNHAAMTQVAQRTATGRKQPYAADKSQQAIQAPNPALQNQPQHTFFQINAPATNPFDWLVFIDRPLISPIELLQVSGYKPHELTQQFVSPDAQNNVQRFNHRAPWFDPSSRIYRVMEFLTAGCPVQWVPSGGRNMGKINVNNVWDVDTLMALCDPTPNNFFTVNDISGPNGIFSRMVSQRTPNGSPGPNDRPFRGLAAPYSAAGDSQYPNGVGIDDTLLASDKTDPNPNPVLRRRLFEQTNLSNNANGNPYIRYELMKKIFNSLTTRSNVFAVWVTVGFFEVVDNSDPTRPPRLGAEINKAEGRHVRHRMFAIVDRSALTIDPANPAKPGPDPVYLPSQTAVTTPGQATTISVPGVSGNYEGLAWKINVGDQLVVDVAQNQETVTATAVGSAPPQITATFTKTHAAGFAIGNATLGNPGPQPYFDPRNPVYSRIVRYFSLID